MGEADGIKEKKVQGAGRVSHLRATRLRSRPSSNSTSIGSLDGKTTGGPALFEAFILLVLLVRRLEDGV